MKKALTPYDREYWKLKPIKQNWCIHNQGLMTAYGALYCEFRRMTVNRQYQCENCTDKTSQYDLFMKGKAK